MGIKKKTNICVIIVVVSETRAVVVIAKSKTVENPQSYSGTATERTDTQQHCFFKRKT